MAKSVGNTLMVSEVVKRVPPIALRYYLVAAHYRSIIEFSEESLAEAAVAWERIEGFVRRATEVVGDVALGEVTAGFGAALDDDLSVPAALADLQASIADGNKRISADDTEGVRLVLGAVRSALDVLGLDPLAPNWNAGGSSAAADQALGVLVGALLDQRQAARAAKDYAAADAARDQLAAAGIEVEDTPQGPRWSVS
jgi:cysteinyl-tRNA synthetase